MASFSNNNVAVSKTPLSRAWQRRRHCRVSLSGFKREKKTAVNLQLFEGISEGGGSRGRGRRYMTNVH
jgi:hypothetical protein